MNKKTLLEGGGIVGLIAVAVGLDPAVIAKLWEDLTPAKAAVIVALLVFVYMRENPITKAKIRDLTARASVPPGAP
jgi:hypothetical protein